MMHNNFPIKFELKRGVDGDNGATPWYTVLEIGQNKQKLNFAFDSGTSYSWVTSSRCTTNACLMHERFKFNNSPSFQQVSDQFAPLQISFGPWGTMDVSAGRDTLSFKNTESGENVSVKDYTLYLSHAYSGSQFENLVWDGAIGIPSAIIEDNTKPPTSKLINQLLKSDRCKHKTLKFNYKHQCIEIGTHESHLKFKHKLKHNKDFKELWFLNLHKIEVNSQKVRDNEHKSFKNIDFCIDTGSSRFKGDPQIINAIVKAITFGGLLPTFIAKKNPTFEAYPELLLTIDNKLFRITPLDYFEKISEELYVLAFNPMEGLKNMLLAGSVFLEKFNPVFFYDETAETGTHLGFD